MSHELVITDEKHSLYGETVMGDLFYYDVDHTGDSVNLYFGKTKEGTRVSLYSDQLDEKYYWEQRRNNEIKELGANVGDLVEIIRTGSGHFDRGWKKDGVHTITKINPVGYVEFDNGAADCFRPTVKPV